MNKKLNKNKGITLISLVITIIVMLILVGVSITLAVNGGLFEYAGNAVGDTRNAINQEQSLIDEIIDKYIVPNVPIEEKFSEIYGENVTITQGEYTATIPAGFSVGTSDGINKIKNGLVITDEVDENGNSIGNEFVWVPCTTEESELNKKAVQYAKDTEYQLEEGIEYEYSTFNDWKDDYKNTTSVETYGGFYVARYEAGIPSNAPFYANTDGAEYKYKDEEGKIVRDTDSYIPVSKKNNLCWGGISQKNAITVSTNMYKDGSSVTSSLIDSYAWDTIVNWMESKEEYKGIATDSTKYGNCLNSTLTLTDVLYAVHKLDFTSSFQYKSKAITYNKGNVNIESREQEDEQVVYELATGSTESTKVLNIYDMAGNMWEWTTEYTYKNANIVIRRGGCFFDPGDTRSISMRVVNWGNDTKSPENGFRVVLYIK